MMGEVMSEISLARAQAAKRTALRRFKKLGSVTGVGITRVRGEYAVKVNLSEPIEPGVTVPSDIGGVPLRVEVTGGIKAR
jgi:hypothetical protein